MVLAVALYLLIRWAHDARALRVMLGIVLLHAAAQVARHFDLVITSWVLEGAAVTTVAFLLVVFQPEIRRALTRFDGSLLFLSHVLKTGSSTHQKLAEAAFSLAASRTGALIAIVRNNSITELTDGGVKIGAEVSAPLIEAIFHKPSPLHDGAVIVEGDRILRARVFLPLTQRHGFPRSWGSRHRAAIGLAERSDATVLSVSEQTGEVHLMQGREIRRLEDVASLVRALQVGHEQLKMSFWGKLRRGALANLKPKLAALGLAFVLWAISSLWVAASVRSVDVPVEFSNVPAGMVVVGQSTTDVRVQLRGSEWLLDSVDLNNLIAHVDLRGAGTGWQRVPLPGDTLDLPHGIVIDQISPRTVSVQLVHRKG